MAKKKRDVRKTRERKEALMRIVVAIVSGIVLEVWGYFVFVLTIIHWIYALFTGKRKKEFADLCEIWNTQLYTYARYLTGVTNKRPFPFEKLIKNISKFEKK